jgi:hypothetical protein
MSESRVSRQTTDDGERVCKGCGMPYGERHRPECPYAKPWPGDRVDNVQTQIEPV